MLNPFKWKPEQLVELVIAMVAGAAIGLGLGHAVRAPARSWGLGEWIGYYPVDAIF
jgi:hypothetical protein